MTVERKRNGHFIANLKPRKGSRHCLAALTSLISLSRTAIVSFLLSSRLHLVGISYLVEKSEAVRKDFSLSCHQTCLLLCPCSLAPLLNPPPITSQTWKSYAGHLLEDSPCLHHWCLILLPLLPSIIWLCFSLQDPLVLLFFFCLHFRHTGPKHSKLCLTWRA